MAVTNEQISAYLAANPGMTDAQIAAAMTQHGVTPDQMTQVTGLDQSAVQSRFDAATQGQASAPADVPIGDFTLSQIASTPGIGTQGIGFGFAPMPLNLNITPSNFLANGAPTDFAAAIRAGTSTNTNQATSTPGALTQATAQTATPTQAATQATGALTQATAQPAAPAQAASKPADRYEVRTETYPMYDTLDYYGNPLPPNPEITRYFDKTTGKEVSAREYRIGTETATPTDLLAQQILGQGFADKWTGEGFGSADANAEAMASRLASIGITDINQFGKVDKYEPVDVIGHTLNGKFVQNPRPGSYYEMVDVPSGEEGYSYQIRRDLTPEEVAQVQPVYGRATSTDEYNQPVYEPVSNVVMRDGKPFALTGQTFGNKVTGQVLNPEYDFAGGDIWGGTFAGKGRTGYGVQFRPDGTPVFYTQYGGSSNTLANLINDLGPLGQIGLAIATGGLSIPQQIAAQAALSIASGADIKDVAKNVAVSTIMQGIPGSSIVKEGADFLNTVDSSGVLGNAFKSATSSAAKAVLTDQDVSDAILSGAVGGATTGAIDLIASNIDGFSTLPPAQQSMVKNVISGITSGQPIDQTLINTAIAAGTNAVRSAAAQNTTAGGITNRIPDDMTEAGASAFADAKRAGASDDEAMGASNAVTGVVINPIPESGPSNVVTTTYGQGGVDTNFGDLQGAIESNAMNDAVRADKLNLISNEPKFADAYSQARSLLGPNQTFMWKGKEYSTATAKERPDLSAPAVQAATDESAAETARLAAQNRELGIANAPNQSAAETARLAGQNATLKSMEKTGFLGQIYKYLNEQFRLQGEAANDYLKNNPNSPITASVSSAFEAAGELQRNLGGVALALDNKPLADAIISGGKKLQDLGQSIGTAPEDVKNWNDTLNLVSKAQGTEKLAVLAGRIMDGTSGLARQVGVELRQELPALFLGGGLLRPTMIASGLIDTADTAGGAVVEAYDEVIKNGKSHQEALSAGRRAGAAAGATEAAIQLTFGKLGEVAVGKLDNLITKGATKVAGEGTVEGLQEAGSSAAVDLALGNAIDVNKALTQGIVGAAVGKGTAASTTPVDVATTPGLGGNEVTQTAVTNISNNINTAISSGGSQNVGPVITESVTTSINSGANANAVVDSAVSTAIAGGADPVVVVDNTITSAINSGAPVDTTIGSAISSAVNAGADVSVVIDAATKAADSTGNTVTIASDANTVTINNATTNTGTTVDTITGSTVTVNNTTNETTIVDPASNTTTQVSFDGNTQTTVIKDQANNTETVIKTDTNTGEVLEQSETQAPPSGTTTTGQPAAADQAVIEGIVDNKLGSLESRMNDAIADVKASGVEGDKVVQTAIDKVATDLGVTRESLLSRIEETGIDLRSEIEKGLSGVSAELRSSYDALNAEQKSLAESLASQGLDLETAISVAQEQTEQKISTLESKFSDAIARAENAGIERDQAIQLAVDSVAKDLGLTRSEVISQLGTTESTLRSEFGAGISNLESQMRDQYNSLTTEQKALADAMTNQGADLKTAIESAKQETQKQVQEQIQGVSEDVRSKYDALSAQQKTLADSLTSQGVDLRSAIDTAQKQTQEQVQQQIEGVSADVRAKYDDLTAQQKTLADSLTSQGVDLKSAIAQAQEQTQSQIQGVSADVKAKYDALTSEQKTLSDALTNQGIDLKTAIDTAQKQTQEQLQGVTQDFQTKYENLSTQQKALADSLVEQGVNVNQAINTAQSVLQGQISKVSADVEAQYNELTSSQKDLADALVEQGVELKDALEFMKETLEKSFTERQDKLEKAMRLQGGQSQALGTIGPATILGLTASSLGSRETQKSIDPLARVKQAQAELEKEAIMNQIDPRLMSVMQQRMDPQQQSNQFNRDIGALASLLGGEETPANEGQYYSYGSEDSIDDILGGSAVGYKAGGYVEPLKASGGSMALPLLVKSGGALDKYHGRENFKEGKHVAGEGDGQSDDIPAWLADGEFVFPADVVSALGNGSTKAGTDKLYEMMHNIRERARSKGPKDLPPPAFKSPLDYLKSSKRSTK